MGNVEKWVVLGVLALIVGILVVSLNVDDPLKKDKVVFAGGTDKPAVAAADAPKSEAPRVDPGLPPVAGQASGSALLSTNVDTSAPAATPTLPSGSILKTMDGLQESYMTDAMFYTWKNGDTFPILAQRFYGDSSRLAILKRINEGRTEVQPGERVLIPLFDLDAVQTPAPAAAASAPLAAGTQAAPLPKSGAQKKPEPATPLASSSPSTPISTAGARVHIVKDGESLWKIAKQELGSGARWNEIYTANRDVLASPEALHTGQKLRVP